MNPKKSTLKEIINIAAVDMNLVLSIKLYRYVNVNIDANSFQMTACQKDY